MQWFYTLWSRTESIPLPHRLQAGSLLQGLLTLIFPRHPRRAAATRQQRGKVKPTNKKNHQTTSVWKQSTENPEDNLCITHLQHRAPWCWVFLELVELVLPVHRTQQLQRGGLGGVSSEHSCVRISPHKHSHTFGKHHVKIKAGVIVQSHLQEQLQPYRYFFCQIKISGELEVSSKSTSPFFTSQHQSSNKSHSCGKLSSTEVGVALLCFRGWIFSTCPQFSAQYVSILNWIFRFPARPK